jgi:hypothetical protein
MHAAAERSSVATTTAFAIVVERAVIERDLEQRGLAQRARELDAIAAHDGEDADQRRPERVTSASSTTTASR